MARPCLETRHAGVKPAKQGGSLKPAT